VQCLQTNELFRVTRLLSDYDSDTCWYVLQPVHGNQEIFRSVKLIDDEDFFTTFVPPQVRK